MRRYSRKRRRYCRKHDEQKKAEEEAKAQLATAQPAASPASVSPGTPPDALWRGTYQCDRDRFPSPMNLEVRLTNGTGTWNSPNASASNNETVSVRLSVDWPAMTVARVTNARASTTTQLSGRLEGNAIRASNSICTLILTRDGPSAPIASSPAQPNVAASAPPSAVSAVRPTDTAYDGAYSTVVIPNASGGSVQYNAAACDKCSRLTVGLRISSGRGSGTLDTPGCSTSLFSVTISPTGEISGEGYFNCVISSGTGAISAGPLKVEGSFKDGKPDLFLSTGRSTFRALLSRGAAASASLPSPDGLWRGTYSCGAVIGSRGSVVSSFTLDLTMQLVNRSASWKPSYAVSGKGGTLEIRVSVDSTTASVTRFLAEGGADNISSLGKRSTLSGQYDGNTIRATGRETAAGYRECVLALTRAT